MNLLSLLVFVSKMWFLWSHIIVLLLVFLIHLEEICTDIQRWLEDIKNNFMPIKCDDFGVSGNF